MKRMLASTFLALTLLLSLTATAFAASAFQDVPDTHWASSYIQQAYEKGWVNGMTAAAYAPSGTLTRAQFLKMVTAAFYSAETEETTPELDGAAWYYVYWTVAQNHGLTKGTPMTDLSKLETGISRYEMAQTIANLLAAKEISANGSAVNKQSIQDWSSIPANYQDAVTASYAAGILNGKNGAFAGQDTMTRAEAAAVLCRMDAAAGQESSTQTPVPAQTPAAAPATATPEEFAAEVVRLVNAERAKAGLSALGTYDALTKAAQVRAQEIVTRFEHTRPDGTSYATVLDETGATNNNMRSSGENIAAGQPTPAAVMESWMNSPGHKANILRAESTHIGVAYVKSSSGYGHYWVQVYSRPSSTATQTPATQTPATQTPATQTPAAQTPATPSATPEELAAEVVRLVNVERAKEGLSPLGTFDSLTEAAQIRAPELPALFSHTRPDGSSCFTALDKTGAKTGAYTWGENIAAGRDTAAGVVDQWMNSTGHRENILNKDFTHIGVAYVKSSGGYGHYWVQMFVGTNKVPGSTPTQTPTTQTPTTQTPAAQTPAAQQPAAQTPAAPSATPEELAAEVVRLVNVERAKEGLSPLGTFDSLTEAAQIRAPELPTLFSHTRPDGSSCFTALDKTGAKTGAYTWGENVAAGSSTAAGVMEQWMNSDGHRANILDKDFTHIGVAYVKSSSGYGHYWVQMFVGTNKVPGSAASQTPTTQTPAAQTPATQQPDTAQTPAAQQPAAQTPAAQESDEERRTSTYLAKKVSLSCLARYNMPSDSFSTTELYIYTTSDFYGKDYTVSWSVDNPDILRLEEITSKSGNPAVRFYGRGVEGQARITCTVTASDGMTATQFCDVTVVD